MACADLLSGRMYPCKKSVGGIKEVYVSTNVDIDSLDYSSDINSLFEINNGDWFKFEVAGTQNTFTEVSAVDRNNRTNIVSQELIIRLPVLANPLGMDDRVYADGGEVEGEQCDGFPSNGGQDLRIFNPLMWKDSRVIVRDRNGATFLIGFHFGCDVTIESTTGGAMEEFSGHNLTFVAIEKRKMVNVQNSNGVPIMTGTAQIVDETYTPNFT